MDWIDHYFSRPLFRSNSECRSEGWNVLNKTVSAYWVNPVGMAEYSHGIHPLVNNRQSYQVPLEKGRHMFIFVSKVLKCFKSIFGSSLSGLVSFYTNHPGLKSGAIVGRPCRGFSFFNRDVSIRLINDLFKNLCAFGMFVIEKRRLA